MNIKQTIIDYAKTLTAVQVDSPFKKFPDYVALRHQGTSKWFGLVMTVEKRNLGINATGRIDILDVKADPEIITILKKSAGYLPAYHMNKSHWLTVLLDGTIDIKQLTNLLQDSYELTRK